MCIGNNAPQGVPVSEVAEINDVCPHCGGRNWVSRFDDLNYGNRQVYYVLCNDCQAQGPIGYTRGGSIARWQQRAEKGQAKI